MTAESTRAYYHRKKNDPEWAAKERERQRAKARRQHHEGNGKRNQLRWRLKRLGLSLDDFDRMKDAQGGVCAICAQPCDKGGELAVDHCHETGAVRGLLCRNCNVGLGYFRDNPEALRSAANYLDHQEEDA